MKPKKTTVTEERVLSILAEYGPATLGQLAGRIGTGRSLRRILDSLVLDVRVARISKGLYQLTYGESKKGGLGSAVPKLGDTFVGVLNRSSSNWFISPLNPGYKQNVYVRRSRSHKVGDLVKVKLEPTRHGDSIGVIHRTVSHENVVDGVVNACVDAYSVPRRKWKKSTSSSFSMAVTDTDLRERVDYRSLPLVTIDGATARDFDDAVFAESVPSGGWRLVVAIADVGHFVRPGSDIDTEAWNRGTSVYFPDRVIPMLPERLSNYLCSLRPNEDRLAVVCDMSLSSDGDLTAAKFVEGVICSKARLTYTEVASFLRGEVLRYSRDISQSVSQMQDVMNVLRNRRVTRGALDFDSQEAVVNVERGNPTHAFVPERNDAHRLIEEAMICANVAAAEFLENNRIYPLYRVHDLPKGRSYENLRDLFQTRGVRLPERIDSAYELQQRLESLREHLAPPRMRIWEQAAIRALQLAQYSPQTIGHFGLGLDSYVHFTSPIRRYPDLYTHRLIKDRLNGKKKPSQNSLELDELGAHLSETEQRANAVTRKVDEWLKCLLLRRRVGDELVGVVGGITDFGMFVELDEFWVSGLVHVSDLPNDYYDMIGVNLVGRKSGYTFRLGDRYRVALDAVIPDLGHVNLRLVDGPL